MVESLTLAFALAGGVLSFFSPCVLPLIPAYLGHIAGVNVKDLDNSETKNLGLQKQVFKRSVFFVAGFASIFIVLGLALAGALSFFDIPQIWLNRVGGTVIIAFGLHTLGFLKIPGLDREIRSERLAVRRSGNVSSAALGVSFGAGWTPCFSPILGSILVVAGTAGTVSFGALLLGVYSLGLGIPFLLAGLFTSSFSRFVKKFALHSRPVTWITAGLLIGLGVLVFTGNVVRLLGLALSL